MNSYRRKYNTSHAYASTSLENFKRKVENYVCSISRLQKRLHPKRNYSCTAVHTINSVCVLDYKYCLTCFKTRKDCFWVHLEWKHCNHCKFTLELCLFYSKIILRRWSTFLQSWLKLGKLNVYLIGPHHTNVLYDICMQHLPVADRKTTIGFNLSQM